VKIIIVKIVSGENSLAVEKSVMGKIVQGKIVSGENSVIVKIV
jgi:hypothetical protein